MKPNSETILLRDEGEVPTDFVLEETAGKSLFDIYQQLVSTVAREHGLEIQWRYYKDGKAWLCKAERKKKTVFWLSVWEGFVRTSFYFTEKTISGLLDLDIEDELKTNMEHAKPVGKLLPFIVDISSFERLADFIKIVEYKKSLK